MDFYGGNSRIGGGCPWGKDPTKADVSLNILARKKALAGLDVYPQLKAIQCAISCCIGRPDIRVTLYDDHGNLLDSQIERQPRLASLKCCHSENRSLRTDAIGATRHSLSNRRA